MACVAETRQLLGCPVCDIDLPLREPAAHEQGERFRCTNCSTNLFAVFVPGLPKELQCNAWRESSDPAKAAATDARLRMSAPSGMIRTPLARKLVRESATGAALVARPRGTASKAPDARGAIVLPDPTPMSRRLDAEILSGAAQLQSVQGPPLLGPSEPRGTQPYDRALAQDLEHTLDDTVARLERLFDALNESRCIDFEQFVRLASGCLQNLAHDLDLFVALGINPPECAGRHRHGVHVAMLAMAVAASMRFDAPTVADLGLGCLLHDVGMLRVAGGLLNRRSVLAASDFNLIVQHPLHTFALLESYYQDISPNARLVAYQMHERCNGSGYPRGLDASLIHPLAKIASVADTYVALVSPRPHRAGLLPYFAIRHLLYEVRSGLHDADVVRSFLRTLSLFPLGSYVRLTNGSLGRVMRASVAAFDKPVVEIVAPDGTPSSEGLIDLSREKDLNVAEAVPSPV